MDDFFNIPMEDFENEEVAEETQIETENPFFSISTVQLLKFLQLAEKFAWRTGRDLTSKSVTLTLTEDKSTVLCRATDFDNYLTYKISVLNTSSQKLDDTLIFSTKTLKRLCDMCRKFKGNTTIMKGLNDSNPSILIMGQWVTVETVETEASLYINNDAIKDTYTLPSIKLSSLIPVVAVGANPKDRQINVFSDNISMSYLWSKIRIKNTSPIEYVLTAREAKMLEYIISKSDSMEVFLTNSDLPRIGFSTDIATLLMIYRKPEPLKMYIPEHSFHIEIDASILNKIIQISDTLSQNATSQIMLEFNEHFICTVVSSLSSTPYTIPSLNVGRVPTLSKVPVQTALLKNALMPITSDNVSIFWNETTLYITSVKEEVSIDFVR